MLVDVINAQKDLKISKKQVKQLVEFVLSYKKEKCEEISIHFVSSSRISDLHQEFFEDPSLTDCITILVDEDPQSPYRFLGEVFVCPQVAIHYATSKQKDIYEEVTLYIIHGLLHLIGYNDIEKEDRSKMRRAERQLMSRIKQLNLQLTKC